MSKEVIRLSFIIPVRIKMKKIILISVKRFDCDGKSSADHIAFLIAQNGKVRKKYIQNLVVSRIFFFTKILLRAKISQARPGDLQKRKILISLLKELTACPRPLMT